MVESKDKLTTKQNVQTEPAVVAEEKKAVEEQKAVKDYSKYTLEDYYQLTDVLEKYECFKQMMRAVHNEMAERIVQSINKRKKDSYDHRPQEITSTEAAQYLLDKRKILVLTGAGLSAASGIPTFRGENGFWKRTYAGVGNPMDILTKNFFKENPEANWQWHYDFFELQKDGKPNQGHKSILEFQEYCHQNKSLECMLVTQNIDDYHCQMIRSSQILNKRPDDLPLAFTPHVHEIHGNVFYMHCSKEDEEHSKDFFPCPSLQEVEDKKNHVPICTYPGCGANMKPHCMFFDECYNEHYYREQTVEKFLEFADCCIVIGTALQTNFARRICETFLNRYHEAPVIEINLESALEYGHVLTVKEKSEVALPKMFEEFYKLAKQ